MVRTHCSVAALVALAALLAGCGGSDALQRRDAPAPAEETPRAKPAPAVAVDCSTRSWADFGAAFSDPVNLVVGPFVLVGGAAPSSSEVVRKFGGQKFPALVRQGRVVTVEVPADARGFASLGYGPLPQGEIGFRDGHQRVTFTACGAGEPSGSTADGPVTFWSGFVLARKPACVPLDVYVDDEPAPHRVEIVLGRAC